MGAPVASFTKKLIASFFAFTLIIGLVPITAFAQPAQEDDELTVVGPEAQAETRDLENASSANDPGSSSVEDVPAPSEDARDARPEGAVDDLASLDEGGGAATDMSVVGDEGMDASHPAGDIISEEVALDTVVAQAESTRSFFLASTMESTRSVPVVSAKLPLDKNDGVQGGSDDSVSQGSSEGASDDAPEDGSDGGAGEGEVSDGSALAGGIASDSVVVGSFVYRGITYAVEPGGESVAVVAAGHGKLPSDFIEAQAIVLP